MGNRRCLRRKRSTAPVMRHLVMPSRTCVRANPVRRGRMQGRPRAMFGAHVRRGFQGSRYRLSRRALADAEEKSGVLQLEPTKSGRSVAATPPDPLQAPKYRVPLAPSLGGNTVDVQLEQASSAETSVRYQASLNSSVMPFAA